MKIVGGLVGRIRQAARERRQRARGSPPKPAAQSPQFGATAGRGFSDGRDLSMQTSWPMSLPPDDETVVAIVEDAELTPDCRAGCLEAKPQSPCFSSGHVVRG